VQEETGSQGVTRLVQQHKRAGERQMSYLIQVAHQRPMLRITAEVVLAFCCAAPLILALSSLVAYGVHAMTY
jgi:hypothetical protein